jgi:hypothetical protein
MKYDGTCKIFEDGFCKLKEISFYVNLAEFLCVVVWFCQMLSLHLVKWSYDWLFSPLI